MSDDLNWVTIAKFTINPTPIVRPDPKPKPMRDGAYRAAAHMVNDLDWCIVRDWGYYGDWESADLNEAGEVIAESMHLDVVMDALVSAREGASPELCAKLDAAIHAIGFREEDD